MSKANEAAFNIQKYLLVILIAVALMLTAYLIYKVEHHNLDNFNLDVPAKHYTAKPKLEN